MQVLLIASVKVVSLINVISNTFVYLFDAKVNPVI